MIAQEVQKHLSLGTPLEKITIDISDSMSNDDRQVCEEQGEVDETSVRKGDRITEGLKEYLHAYKDGRMHHEFA